MPDILNEALSDSLTIDSDIRRDYYCVCVCSEESLKPPERQDTVLSFHTIGSSKDVTGSSSTLQVCHPLLSPLCPSTCVCEN